MRLMDKLRSDSRERDSHERDRDRETLQREAQRQAREHESREREAREGRPLNSADLADDRRAAADGRGGDTVPMQVMDSDRDETRHVDEPAGKLHAADVQDAVEISRRETRTRASSEQPLAPLFSGGVAQDFQTRWDAAQIGFVDNPRQAVQQADELVAQVMNSLTQSFADERHQLEAQMHDEKASTENLRVALQRYRSFFQRLLAL